MTIYYPLSSIGEHEFKFETFEQYENNKQYENESECTYCSYSITQKIYVFTSITDIFPIFKFSTTCSFNSNDFKLKANRNPELYFDISFYFPTKNLHYKEFITN